MRKKWRITDPAHVAPNCYHRDLFAANFPLVKVVDVPPGAPFPVQDKFEGNVLDAEATAEARKRWIRRYFEVHHTYGMAENDQQAFPQHFAFMESLMQFTLPSTQDLQIHNERCVGLKHKLSYDEVQVETKRRRLDADSEQNAGLHIVLDTEDVQSPLGPNHSDGEIAAEEVAKLAHNLEDDVDAVTGFANGVLHVMDYRPLDRAVHNTVHNLNPDRVVAILERKFAEDLHKWNARFQGGFYAVKHCMVNLQRGHGAPVYVLVMTSSLWTYGILVPEGCVHIRDGEVDVKCMPEFKCHQAITGVSETGLEELQEKLKGGTEFYRKNYRENPHADYADGPMLVGTYYLNPRWFSLPKPEPGNGKVDAVRRYFDGLMRLVLGDSVIDLKSGDYKWRWQLRERMLREEIDFWC